MFQIATLPSPMEAPPSPRAGGRAFVPLRTVAALRPKWNIPAFRRQPKTARVPIIRAHIAVDARNKFVGGQTFKIELAILRQISAATMSPTDSTTAMHALLRKPSSTTMESRLPSLQRVMLIRDPRSIAAGTCRNGLSRKVFPNRAPANSKNLLGRWTSKTRTVATGQNRSTGPCYPV